MSKNKIDTSKENKNTTIVIIVIALFFVAVILLTIIPAIIKAAKNKSDVTTANTIQKTPVTGAAVTTNTASDPSSSGYSSDISDYDYDVLDDGTLRFKDYIDINLKGTDEHIPVVPKSLNGMTVTVIAEHFLKNVTNVRKLYLPNTIKKIENNAFADCDGIQEIVYLGTEDEWKSIEIGSVGNELLKSVMITFNK